MGQNAECLECGKKIKEEIAEQNKDWVKTDDGWLSPHCNPDSDKSWG